MPQTVAYCHCADCRRVTGAPVAAFAAFATDDVVFSPDNGPSVSWASGVTRHFCPDCGSPLAGFYDYLPGQVFVPIGLLDQADRLRPELHAHDGARLDWLCIEDDLERTHGSSRAALTAAGRRDRR
ncbi:MAG: GFA family protein [Pseudomonadota bacterium]